MLRVPVPVPGLTAADRFPRRFAHLVSAPWLPAVLLAAIALVDLLRPAVELPLVLDGVLDETAHLATSALLVLAVAGPRAVAARPWPCLGLALGSTVIDLDHTILYTNWFGNFQTFRHEHGRPYSHSLVTILVVLVLAAAARRGSRGRAVLLGGAVGLALHFFRDFSEGPGVPLFWPATTAALTVPYPWYGAVVVVSTVVATARSRAAGRAGRTSSVAPGRQASQ